MKLTTINPVVFILFLLKINKKAQDIIENPKTKRVYAMFGLPNPIPGILCSNNKTVKQKIIPTIAHVGLRVIINGNIILAASPFENNRVTQGVSALYRLKIKMQPKLIKHDAKSNPVDAPIISVFIIS